MSDTKVIPFGKYKGQPVDVLSSDRGYCDWLVGQDWARERFPWLTTIIINNFAEPSETPAHNRIQVRFLDSGFQLGFAKALGNPWVVDPGGEHAKAIAKCKLNLAEAERKISELGSYLSGYSSRSWKEHLDRQLASLTESPSFKFDIAFEYKGWDVIVGCSTACGERHQYLVEIKPSLGDDFPAVLRQMRAQLGPYRDYQAHDFTSVLLIEQFAASGASFEEVGSVFSSARIRLMSVDEIAG